MGLFIGYYLTTPAGDEVPTNPAAEFGMSQWHSVFALPVSPRLGGVDWQGSCLGLPGARLSNYPL